MIPIAATPKGLKIILKAICFFTLALLALESFFAFPVREFFLFNNLFYERLFLWQPITSSFIIQIATLSFSELFDATFLLILFWITALEVYLSFGAFRFYTLAALVLTASALTATCAMKFLALSCSFSLLPQIILACTTVWAICPTRVTPASMLFFPMPTRYILVIALLATIGYNTLTHDYVRALTYSATFVTTYIISIGCWFLPSPFACCYRLDAYLRRTYSMLFRLFNK